MNNSPNIKRWGLFRTDGQQEVVRRYQLARLEEVALAYPVPGSGAPKVRRPSRGGGAPLREPGAT